MAALQLLPPLSSVTGLSICLKLQHDFLKREWEALKWRSKGGNERMEALEKRWEAAEQRCGGGKWNEEVKQDMRLVLDDMWMVLDAMRKVVDAMERYKAVKKEWNALMWRSEEGSEMIEALEKRWKAVDKSCGLLTLVGSDQLRAIVDKLEEEIVKERYKAVKREWEALEWRSEEGSKRMEALEKRWKAADKLCCGRNGLTSSSQMVVKMICGMREIVDEMVATEKTEQEKIELAANVILARVGDSSVHTQGSEGREYVRGMDGGRAYKRVLELAAKNPNKLFTATKSLLADKHKGN